jgi:hypothetical protein
MRFFSTTSSSSSVINKFCVNCLFCKDIPVLGQKLIYHKHGCAKFYHTDFVTGKIIYADAHDCRQSPAKCGPTAHFYQEIPEGYRRIG